MYDFSVQVAVKALERNRRILIEWSAYGDPTTVEWVFTPRADDTTFVLAGAKALLEHNVILNLVPDRFPDGVGG